MKIPSAPAERHEFYLDLIQKCRATVDTRREFYKQSRSYYLFGCPDRAVNSQNRFNKIYPQIDTVASFVFSPETTRFTIDLGPSVNTGATSQIPAMVERMGQIWSKCALDRQFGQAVRWSAPYGKVLLKLRPKVSKRINRQKELEKRFEIQSFIVEPHNFGVLREDKGSLKQQEAFCETFYTSISELRNNLASSGKKPDEVSSIIEKVQATQGNEALSEAIPGGNLTVTAVQGDAVTGNASVFSQSLSTLYRATTKEPLTMAHELYVYDDDAADYRVVTYVSPDILIFDRPIEEIFLAGRYPYIEVGLSPTYDYFWWYSEVEKLVPLQDLRNDRMDDIIHIMKKQAHPPHLLTGTNALEDEMLAALDTPGGAATVDNPNADIKKAAPDLPADLWQDILQLDEMFDEISGLSGVTQGKQGKGKSEAQARLASALGSTRIRDRALIIEDSLDECAQLIVELMKRYDDRQMREDDDEGSVFNASQFPDDYEAKVDGHSNSPLFVEAHEQKAYSLFDRKVIDGEELLDLIEIPMRAALKKKLREKIEPAQAKEHEEELALKKAQILSKRSHGGHGPSAAERAQPPPLAPTGTEG